MTNPKQIGFFDGNHPKSATILIKDKHELLLLANITPWPEMIETAINIRLSRVKVASGPEPHYRELLGAVTLMSVRSITYRQAEDLIAHYAPARYLCGLMDSTWQPDHITIFEFTQMMGPEGMDLLNKKFLFHAKEIGILDSSTLMSDTTAQEAMIPYPNEVGLMKRFTELVAKNLKKVGGKFAGIKGKVIEIASKVRSSQRLSSLCQDERRKAQGRERDLSHDYRAPRFAQELFKPRVTRPKQGLSRACAAIKSDELTLATDLAFFRNWLCCSKKDHPSSIPGTLRHCSWQGWKESGVWSEVGNQSNRWFCIGIFNKRWSTLVGSEVLHRGHQRARRSFWGISRKMRVRPRWLQSCQHQEGREAWGETCWYSSYWENQVVSLRENGRGNQVRAGPSRRGYWQHKIKKVRLQQTQHEKYKGNGDLWPPLIFGLQPLQSGKKNKSSSITTRIITDGSRHRNETPSHNPLTEI